MSIARHSGTRWNQADTDVVELDPGLRDDGIKTLSVVSLSLSNFRNYASLRLELSPQPVVLTGYNGAGKTNILEALSLLSPGRGLRKAKLSGLNNHQTNDAWAIAATASGMQGEVRIGTGRDPETLAEQTERRLVRIDGKPARSQADLSRHMALLWLTPQMEQLFNEGASAGRKFLDRMVYLFDAEHASRINEYEFAMRERTRLLQDGPADSNWLDALEQTMAETACAIAAARLSAVASINHAIATSPLSFPKATVDVFGIAENLLQAGESAVAAEESLKRTWLEGRRNDTAAGRALQGPHRSELQVIHSEKQMPAGACSTGEQKALLLSMVLAQARAGALWKRVIPVLLLDEIITHLDAIRRLELFQEICQIGAQVWMTGTDASLFADLAGKCQHFQVENGHLFPLE